MQSIGLREYTICSLMEIVVSRVKRYNRNRGCGFEPMVWHLRLLAGDKGGAFKEITSRISQDAYIQ